MRTLLLGGAVVALVLAATVAHDTPPPDQHALATFHKVEMAPTPSPVAAYVVAPASAVRVLDLSRSILAVERAPAMRTDPRRVSRYTGEKAGRVLLRARLTNLLALRGGRGFL